MADQLADIPHFSALVNALANISAAILLESQYRKTTEPETTCS